MVLGSGASVGGLDALSSLSAAAFPTVVRQTGGQLDLMTGRPYTLGSDQPSNCPLSLTVGTDVIITSTAFAIPPSAMTVDGAECVADVAGARIFGVHHEGLASLAVNSTTAAELQAAHPNGGLGLLLDGGWTCGTTTVGKDAVVVLFAVASTYTMRVSQCTYSLSAGSPPTPPAPIPTDPPKPQPTPAPETTARPVTPAPEPTVGPTSPLLPEILPDNLPSGTGRPDGPALPATGGAACFPASARVETRAGGHVRVDALRIGDVVRTSADTWSPVYAFSHADAAASAVYVTLTTAAGRLTLTPGHYVPVSAAPAGGHGGDARGTQCAARSRLVAAGAVRVGDALWSRAPAAANASAAAAAGGAWVAVTAVAASAAPERRGLYHPHTLDGALLVDGFAASTYTTALAPRLADAGLAVARLAYRLGAGGVVGGRLVAALGGVSPPAWAAGAPVI